MNVLKIMGLKVRISHDVFGGGEEAKRKGWARGVGEWARGKIIG